MHSYYYRIYLGLEGILEFHGSQLSTVLLSYNGCKFRFPKIEEGVVMTLANINVNVCTYTVVGIGTILTCMYM